VSVSIHFPSIIHSQLKKNGKFRISTKHTPNFFRIHADITLEDLKHQLTQLNIRIHSRDQKRATDVEYRHPSVCSNGTVLFTNMRLRNDGDVRTMFSIFSQYMTNGPIKLDAKLVISVQAICSNLIRPRTFDEIAACMVEPGEDKVEEINSSEPFFVKFIFLIYYLHS
jgi:hypothetical protein